MLRMIGWVLRRRQRGFRKDTSGVTAIEFAMVAPLFFLMLGVMLESGLMMFTEYVLQSSVQEAARKVRTGQAQAAALSAGDFKKEVCRMAKIIISCEAKVTVYMRAEANFNTLAANSPAATTVGVKIDGTTDPVTFQCGAPSQAVSLIATYDWQFAIPYFMQYFSTFGDGKFRRLAGFAMFRNEPFPAANGSCGT
jgi:Flp pilus assembly protein TadG